MAKHQPEDVRRRQILDAAKRCFIAKGLDATTMRDVAKEARLSLGGIYFHYASKADIFRAICNETYGTVLRKWEAEPEQRNSAEGVIMGLARINVEMIETDPDYFRLALVLNGAAVVDTELKNIKRTHHDGFVSFIQSSLEGGVSDGEFEAHNSRAVAESIVALFDGFYLRCAIDANIQPRVSIETALNLLMTGIKK
jgi:AcrR family transcriptional regulator